MPGGDDCEPFLLDPARGWPPQEPPPALLPLPRGVRSLGIVSPEELASLYRRASVTVFPSLYRGFGWPLPEAMASGCPVARPGDIRIVDALEGAVNIRTQGIERAARLTWERCAREHEDVYRDLASQRPRDAAGAR
jgi:glycosyltransferase involved in cell wall biosynthesis